MIFLILLLLLSNNKSNFSEVFCRKYLFLLALLFICNSNASYINPSINFNKQNILYNKNLKMNSSFNTQTQKCTDSNFNNINRTFDYPNDVISLAPNLYNKFPKTQYTNIKDNNTYSNLKSLHSSNIEDSNIKKVSTEIIKNNNYDSSYKEITTPLPTNYYSNSTSIKPLMHLPNFNENKKSEVNQKNTNTCNQNSTLPCLINNIYRGSTVSIIVNGFGTITGEVIFNFNNVTVLKLKDNTTVFINNNHIKSFF